MLISRSLRISFTAEARRSAITKKHRQGHLQDRVSFTSGVKLTIFRQMHTPHFAAHTAGISVE